MNMNTPALRRLIAATLGALGLLLVSCATTKPYRSTDKVTIVNVLKGANVIVISNLKPTKEVVLAPMQQAQFPLGTTLTFFGVKKGDKKEEDMGFFTEDFPAPRASQRGRIPDEVYAVDDPTKFKKGTLYP